MLRSSGRAPSPPTHAQRAPLMGLLSCRWPALGRAGVAGTAQSPGLVLTSRSRCPAPSLSLSLYSGSGLPSSRKASFQQMQPSAARLWLLGLHPPLLPASSRPPPHPQYEGSGCHPGVRSWGPGLGKGGGPRRALPGEEESGEGEGGGRNGFSQGNQMRIVLNFSSPGNLLKAMDSRGNQLPWVELSQSMRDRRQQSFFFFFKHFFSLEQ
jgi:hypothetical protein